MKKLKYKYFIGSYGMMFFEAYLGKTLIYVSKRYVFLDTKTKLKEQSEARKLIANFK